MKKLAALVVAMLTSVAFAVTDNQVAIQYADDMYTGMEVAHRICARCEIPAEKRPLLQAATMQFSEQMMEIMRRHDQLDNWKRLQNAQETRELNKRSAQIHSIEELNQIGAEADLYVSSEYPGVYMVLCSPEVSGKMQRLTVQCAAILRN